MYLKKIINFISSAWIEKPNIQSYHQHKDTLISSSKTGQFKSAVEAIEDFIAKGEVCLLINN